MRLKEAMSSFSSSLATARQSTPPQTWSSLRGSRVVSGNRQLLGPINNLLQKIIMVDILIARNVVVVVTLKL
jgi:hypothetical protein